MYYRGISYPVNIDNVKSLTEKGVLVIVIEKEGILDLLTSFADKYGFSLVHKGTFYRILQRSYRNGRRRTVNASRE